jgi:hypothetical protein
MKPVLKRSLAAIAAAAALASVVAGRERPAVHVVEPAARVETRLQSADELDLAKLGERLEEAAGDKAKNPFAPRNFAPIEPPQKQAAGRKEAPSAPPLPFRYLGKLVDGGKLAVFLARGDESLAVAAGERIGDYRVDSVTDSEVTFTYLPLKTKQSLPL